MPSDTLFVLPFDGKIVDPNVAELIISRDITEDIRPMIQVGDTNDYSHEISCWECPVIYDFSKIIKVVE